VANRDIDGGGTMEFAPRGAIFLRFRVQQDGYATGERDGAFAEACLAHAFYAGFEWPF
jgi:hypothetical protein